jgi:hypothetical protein
MTFDLFYTSEESLERQIERHNLGNDTMICLDAVTDGMIGRRLTYQRLTA